MRTVFVNERKKERNNVRKNKKRRKERRYYCKTRMRKNESMNEKGCIERIKESVDGKRE